ncbi:MAG: hypothetical protein LPK85_07215, partial [Gammaproteobacteria bacterium]|nr:hypothetical protein [Gammaproteobacteria bacterium]
MSEGTKLNASGRPDQLILVIDGSLSIPNNSAAASKRVTVNALIYASGAISIGNNNVLEGAIAAGGSIQVGNSIVQHDAGGIRDLEIPPLCSFRLTCFQDNFNRSQLDEAWATTRSAGPFMPSIVSNRLRLTQASGNQSTASTFQRLFPAADNRVVVEFDYFAWSSAAGIGGDGITVVFSDASITPQPGSFGGSLGYAQRNTGDAGFAGGWLGIGLDEYGNFSNATEGRIGGPGLRAQSIAIRGSGSGTSGYRYLRGTTSLSPAIDRRSTATAAPGHRYRITIDSTVAGTAIVSVERNSGSGFQMLVAPFNALAEAGQSAVPEDFFLSLTGSTGGSNNNHELDNLQVCAKRVKDMSVQIDHFEIVHDAHAHTCQPERLTLRACADAACTTLVTEPVRATLNPADDWVGGRVIDFSGGSVDVHLAKRTAGSVTLGVASSSPPTRPFSQTLCRVGGAAPSAAACGMTFHNSGFIIDAPDGLAGQPLPATITAVLKDEISERCVPAFANVTRELELWTDYVDPGNVGRVASLQASVDAVPIANTNASPTRRVLSFDASGTASVALNYADAGRLSLNARYTGSVANADVGLSMEGDSSFMRRPAGLCLQTEASCPSADASCPVFRKAGEAFPLRITPVAWTHDGDTDLCLGNPPTPSFSAGAIPLTLTLLAPAGGDSGVLLPTSYTHGMSASGQQTVNATLSEVGVFRVSAGPVNYQGMTVPMANSAPIGRITPADFAVTSTHGVLAPTCSAGLDPFAYTGEAMVWQAPPTLEIRPRNAGGGATRNYTGDFFRLDLAGWSRQWGVTDKEATGVGGTLLAVDGILQPGTTTMEPDGSVRHVFSMLDTLTYRKTVDARVAPFTPKPLIELGAFADLDGVVAAGFPQTLEPLAPFEMRYGRLWIDNAYGPETASLTVRMRPEYFNGTRFVVNADD